MRRTKLERVSLAVSCVSITLSGLAIAVAMSRSLGADDPWAVVSGLSATVVALTALLALGQWRRALGTRNLQAAANDVFERAYEHHTLFQEISRHALSSLMNKSVVRQLTASDALLGEYRDKMLEYTTRVVEASSRLEAALFKASVVCGFEFPVAKNELIPLEAMCVWGWMTSAFIKAQGLVEGSEERQEFLTERFSEVKTALDAAPAKMREKRAELRKILAPYFSK